MSGRFHLRRDRATRNDPSTSAPPALDVQALRDDLEVVCLDAMKGDPAGPRLASRLRRTCQTLLRSRRLEQQVRVQVSSSQAGTHVVLLIGESAKHVQRVHLQLN